MAPGGGLSEAGLLNRLADPVKSLSPLPQGVSISEVSSHDLLGGNFDGGSYGQDSSGNGPTGVMHPSTYLRREVGGYVLLDQPGPGCLVRFWMTSIGGGLLDPNVVLGDVSAFGRLQAFFDGRTRPSIDEPTGRFFSGSDPRFPKPLVNDERSSGGGNYSYVPLCFSTRLKIRVTRVPTDDFGYYQMTLLQAPQGTKVETFRGQRVTPPTPRRPLSAPRLVSSRRLKPGQTPVMVRLRGQGTVRYLRLRIAPFTESALQSLSLRVSVNGAPRPQIDVPLGSLFGDGLQTRAISSRGFGMSPATSTGYLSLPIPFSSGALLAVHAATHASVRLEAWTGPATHHSGILWGERHVEHSQLGRDLRVLEVSGSGRLASLVYEVIDGGSNGGGVAPLGVPDQQYMEGDDRIYVDGSRSPAIYGTGTEDIFNGGWYFRGLTFALPMSGAGPLVGTADGHGSRSMYRVWAGDGPTWSSHLRFGIQHGGGDDRVGETVAITTFSYRGRSSLLRTDSVRFGDHVSLVAHRFAGRPRRRIVRSYFEGMFSGNGYRAADRLGTLYPLAPPYSNADAVTRSGIAFGSPVSITLRVSSRNSGVVLRRLLDQSSVAPVEVSVDGRPAGVWTGNVIPNPAKRWLESDFALPVGTTVGRPHIRVTLTPSPGRVASAFELQALSRLSPG